MVFDRVALKSEALLLFIRDLIETYEKQSEDVFSVEFEIEKFVEGHLFSLKKGINAILQNNQYYLRNQRISRIKIILRYYELLNKLMSKEMKNQDKFDPCMLSISMLATWFKEYGYEAKGKEFIFFGIYPYGEIYDTLLGHNKNIEYKQTNIKMITIAEKVMIKFYKEK